jgi:membrane peptidoglycan carboxypeptidase
MVGFTPAVSTAVWVGTDKSDPIRNAQRKPIFGSGLPGQIWHTFMESATEDTPPERFSTFVPIGTPPTADLPSTATNSPDEDEDEDSDSDEDRDSDSRRSSDDDGDSSGDSSSSSNGSRRDNFSSDNDSGSGAGNERPASASDRSQSTNGTDG